MKANVALRRVAACLALSLTLWACGDDKAADKARLGDAAVPPEMDAAKPDPDAGKKPGRDAGGSVEPDAGVEAGAMDAASERDSSVPSSRDLDAGPPPADWGCPADYWADGICDCSCGDYDAWDCAQATCKDPGCVRDSCTACFTATFAWKECAPDPDPLAWTCDESALNDAFCDCGCGYPDPACHGSGCVEAGCWRSVCDFRHHQQVGDTVNAPPPAWKCAKAKFGAGDGCDCGCGVADPDCAFGSPACASPLCNDTGCNACHDKNGHQVICNDAVEDNTWTCDPLRYGSSDGCDCGCGAEDPDCNGDGCSTYNCRPSTPSECKRCTTLPFANDDLTGCTPEDGWTCDPHHYGAGDGCDCGCGIHDPDCGAAANGCESAGCADDGKCDYCHVGAGETPTDYVPCNGWTCGDTDDARWTEQQCDCGCGAHDFYCRIAGKQDCIGAGCTTPVCEYCNDGDDRAACTGERWSGVGGCAVDAYGDGKCDCGCGAIDVDCKDGTGCATSACAANGCTLCHALNGSPVTCLEWTCAKEAYDDGSTCDCGCGAPDPDCSGLGCSQPGCDDESCDACHDPSGRPTAVCR